MKFTDSQRFYSINTYLKGRFGKKMAKLSIEAGFTCPNRDGKVSYGGCKFCSSGGSG
ncbi:MAG: TIGR01212 family radical SAM protein, partial [Mogibacterium sp.]|nr:TIGR01212 family radical SAM protein [Mogibacterium sp.]